MVEDTISEWYEAKHRTASNSEIDFINFILIKCCHHCCSSKIVKNCFNRNNIQNYFCNDCGRNFNPLTNTIFDSRKNLYLNGLSIYFIFLNTILLQVVLMIIEMQIALDNAG